MPPSDVIYMAYGVEIIPATQENEGGVKLNFTMCSGEELLDAIVTCTYTGVPDCKEPTVHEFLSAACNRKSTNVKFKQFFWFVFLISFETDTSTRLVRDSIKRKFQAVQKNCA